MKSFAWLRSFQKKKYSILNCKGRLLYIILVFIFFGALLSVLAGIEPGYSSTTNKCISCHNDTGYPQDTDNDSFAAPYKRPHNGTIMCETCHNKNPHTLTYIQGDGSYKGKSTAASCPECHQAGIPALNNSNFTTAFKVPNPVRHSSDILNGSLWGEHWNNTSPKSACIYCHDKTLHNVSPLGRILQWYQDYVINTSIGNGSTCASCHYKQDSNWSKMVTAFESAGLEIPPEITNGTNWNGTYTNYFNHSIESYKDGHCKQCHGSLLSLNATLSEFVHNVAGGAGEACIGCHTSRAGIYPGINKSSFGSHINVNRSGGNDSLTNEDCKSCHYDFNYTEMIKDGFTTLTRKCTECHVDGVYPAPIISNHRPPKVNLSTGSVITTTAYCSTCHNNSINKYDYSINASVGHYGTNSSLIKPTANQTALPRYGFFDQGEASAYNRWCSNCHTPPNMSYGTPTNITFGHTSTSACSQCHASAASDNLHNSSLGLPLTFSCKDCHTIYADKYNAPNLTGTNHQGYDCQTACHSPATDKGVKGQLDLADHNQDWTMTTWISNPITGTVYLNGTTSLTVSRGTIVNITSNISDSYISGDLASRVRGAEYYINTDPGSGKGIFMEASDGRFDAANGKSENITGMIDTSTLPAGTYTVYVRGMDIGKLWSIPKSAILTVQAIGYIQGTVTCTGSCEGSPVEGATVSVTGGSTTTLTGGFYTISVPEGTYDVTASNRPKYYDNITWGVIVTPGDTTIVDFILGLKPSGNITGNVRRTTG